MRFFVEHWCIRLSLNSVDQHRRFSCTVSCSSVLFLTGHLSGQLLLYDLPSSRSWGIESRLNSWSQRRRINWFPVSRLYHFLWLSWDTRAEFLHCCSRSFGRCQMTVGGMNLTFSSCLSLDHTESLLLQTNSIK